MSWSPYMLIPWRRPNAPDALGHEAFVDRFVAGLAEVSAGRVRPRHVVLTGLCGTGKASLVEACAAAARERGFAVFNPDIREHRLLRSLAWQATRRSTWWMRRRVRDQVGDINIVAALLAQIAQARARKGGGVLIRICEMDQLSEYALIELSCLLRCLRRDDYAHIPVVVLGTGHTRVRNRLATIVDANYDDLYEAVAVRERLSRAETRKILQVPGQRAGLGWDPEALDMVYHETLGHPAYVQILAHLAWLRAHDRRATVVSDQDVIKAITRAWGQFERVHLDPEWRVLTLRQQILFTVLAAHGGVSSLTHVAQAMETRVGTMTQASAQLKEEGLLARAPEGELHARHLLLVRYVVGSHPFLAGQSHMPSLEQLRASAPRNRPEKQVLMTSIYELEANLARHRARFSTPPRPPRQIGARDGTRPVPCRGVTPPRPRQGPER